MPLVQELPDLPHVAERINERPLEHPLDRTRLRSPRAVLPNGIPLRGSGRNSLLVNRDRIVHEQLDLDRNGALSRSGATARCLRLFREEELRAVDPESG